MKHLTDDELVLRYYDEDGPDLVTAERHLQTCADCAGAYEALARTLRAVTPPDIVEPPDDAIAVRRTLLERARHREFTVMTRIHVWLTEPRAIALAWLVPMLYPWAAPVIFAGAQSRDPMVRGVLVALGLAWACAGPAVAMLVMDGAENRFDRLVSRVRVLGAILATVSPSLFMVAARGGTRLDWWYGAVAAAAILALVPWPSPGGSTPRLRRLHGLSSLLLGAFVLGHIVKQSLAFVSVPSYAAMRAVVQLASQQSVSYIVIVTMVTMQILTGSAMGLKNVGTGAFVRNLQMVSGWYLAAFLFSHVLSPYLSARPATAAPVAHVLTPPHLLGNAASVASLPYYLLGVSAFLLHVGLYARLAALGWFAESSVRHWSYAAAVVGAMVVAAVGLSLGGIHIFR